MYQLLAMMMLISFFMGIVTIFMALNKTILIVPAIILFLIGGSLLFSMSDTASQVCVTNQMTLSTLESYNTFLCQQQTSEGTIKLVEFIETDNGFKQIENYTGGN